MRAGPVFPPRLATVRAVQALWQQRLPALRDAGWEPIRTLYQFAYAVNCPPYSFALDDTDRTPCNKYRVCPFCHGLRTSIVFHNVWRAVRQRPVDLYLVVSERHCKPADVDDALRELDERQTNLMAVSAWPIGAINRVWWRHSKIEKVKELCSCATGRCWPLPPAADCPTSFGNGASKLRRTN